MDFPFTGALCKKLFPASKVERVAFFGFADAAEHDPLYKLTKDTARLVAAAGYTVVNGGGPGVMEASSVGAKEAGGRTIGVTFYPKDAQNFEGRSPRNELDEEIITQNYLERTLKLLEYGQVYMIFQGGTGTISEFAMAWGMARLYFGNHKPLILVGDYWHKIIDVFVQTMRIRPEEMKVFSIVNSPQEALAELIELDKKISEAGLKNDDVDVNERPFVL